MQSCPGAFFWDSHAPWEVEGGGGPLGGAAAQAVESKGDVLLSVCIENLDPP